MAFKLTKAEDAQKLELEGRLNEAFGIADDAATALQDKIDELIQAFNNGPLVALNAVVEEAYNFVEDIHRDRQEEYDERSERWQEGDRGQATSEWLNSWEGALSDLEQREDIATPELEIELGDPENVLAGLETEMSA